MDCGSPLHVLKKGYGLQARYVEPLSAADVLASGNVVFAHHIGLSLGEACAIPFVCVSGELGLLTADQPGNFVLFGLATVGASERVFALFGTFVEEIAFFHFQESCFPAAGIPRHPEKYSILVR
jgi:hypothetical protein